MMKKIWLFLKERVGAFSVFWLYIIAKHPLVIPSLFSLILWIIFRVTLYCLGISLTGLAKEAGLNILLLFLTTILPPVITVACLLRHIQWLVKGIGSEPSQAARKMMKLFTLNELQSVHQVLKEIRGEKGAKMDRLRLLMWVRLCFQTFSGRYIGIDSSLPSEFRKRYEGYLDAHDIYLKRFPSIESARIIVRDPYDIDADRYSDPVAFSEFIGWHENRRVRLLTCPVSIAQNAAKENKLETTDVGFWEGQAAILFKPITDEEGNPQIILKMTFPGEELYTKVCQYVKKIEESSSPYPELHMIPKEFIHHWNTFVFPEKRIQTSLPFLKMVIQQVAERTRLDPRRLRILDGAAGTGVEAAELAKEGFWIEINEIDEIFKKYCLDRIKKQQGTPLPPGRVHSVNWRDFRKYFGPETFDVIFILGNSLCLLRDAEDVRNVLEQFYEVLTPGGALVVDERNFAYIWKEWGRTIDPKNPAESYRYSGSVIYCGDRVRGYPAYWEVKRYNGKEVKRIVFRYDMLQNSTWQLLAEISLYPFRGGELLKLLQTACFPLIEVFADINKDKKLGQFEKNSSNNDIAWPEDADFFTYVAYKEISAPENW